MCYYVAMNDSTAEMKSDFERELEPTEPEASGQEPTIEGIDTKRGDNPNIKLNMETLPRKKGNKLIFIIIIIVVILALGAFFLRSKISGLSGGGEAKPTASSNETSAPEPSPIQNPLIRSDLSLEVLNGSGESGLAKTYAGKLKALGYPVVKVGNADKSDYALTEIQVKKDLADKVALVIADLKDTIKIASVGAGLKDSTASARIIIGKDSI